MIPYTRHDVTRQDVEAVGEFMQRAASGYVPLTRGPEVEAFEHRLSRFTGGLVVACNSGTAALHLALRALGVGEGVGDVGEDVVHRFHFPFLNTIRIDNQGMKKNTPTANLVSPMPQ